MRTAAVIIGLLYSVTLAAQQRITLLFVGDLMQHQAQIDAARTADGTYDYRDCFSLVREQISEADIAVGNLEVTLGGKPYRGYPTFSAPDEYLTAIRDAGFDILLTANNHCLDRGKRGLERTLQQLDSLDIPHLGTYRTPEERRQRYPLFITKNGIRLAFLNYTYGTNGIRATSPNVVNYIDREQIRQDILSAKSRLPDAIIACMHWGEEYHSLPNREQRELADWLIRQGVTHVIGSHPHVIQPMELRTVSRTRQSVVAYSLGNFISNMSKTDTDGGLILTLQLEKDPLPYCRVASCTYSLVWTGRPALTRQKNFVLYPADYPIDSLTAEARNRMNRFLDNSRRLLQTHNLGIGEQKK